jgi:uncharacterized membrane protein
MNQKPIFLYLMAAFYMLAGSFHFINTGFYLPIMPSWIPEPKLIVYLSGLLEIALGISILIESFRNLSAWFIIGLLLMYLFIVHIPLTMSYYHHNQMLFNINMARSPLQLLLIYWAYSYTNLSLTN